MHIILTLALVFLVFVFLHRRSGKVPLCLQCKSVDQKEMLYGAWWRVEEKIGGSVSAGLILKRVFTHPEYEQTLLCQMSETSVYEWRALDNALEEGEEIYIRFPPPVTRYDDVVVYSIDIELISKTEVRGVTIDYMKDEIRFRQGEHVGPACKVAC